MSDVIDLSLRRRRDGHRVPLVIERMVDGEMVEYVRADEEDYLLLAEKAVPQHSRCDTISEFKRPDQRDPHSSASQ
jgi:hypothetical protein